MTEMEILRDLVKFNTIQDKENEAILNYIETFLKQFGFQTENKDKNLVVSINKDYRLGFLGHTDTVEIIKGWKTNPFVLTQKGERLYGLGASDMKGGIAAMLKAVSEIDFTKLQYGMKLYFTYDEEIGFQGIQELIEKKEEFPKKMMIGESTNNEYLSGSKGLMEYEICFLGKKVHSSNPEKGKSAIWSCINFLQELKEYYEQKIKIEKRNDFEIPYTTMNVGTIQGGSAINSVPAECRIKIDFRTIKKEHTAKIKNELLRLSLQYDAKLIEIQKIEPFINQAFYQTGVIKTSNYITEASFLKEDIQRLILGPGPMTGHEVDEYIEVESLKKSVKQYKEIILKYLK